MLKARFLCGKELSTTQKGATEGILGLQVNIVNRDCVVYALFQDHLDYVPWFDLHRRDFFNLAFQLLLMTTKSFVLEGLERIRVLWRDRRPRMYLPRKIFKFWKDPRS